MEIATWTNYIFTASIQITPFQDWISRFGDYQADELPSHITWRIIPRVRPRKLFIATLTQYKIFSGHKFPIGGPKK